MIAIISKILGLALLCAVKPVVVIPSSIFAGVSPYQVIIAGILGGCTGIVVYMYGMDFIIHNIQRLWNKRKKKNTQAETKKKAIFTPRNRMIVRMMLKYGLKGIVIITPLLTLPLGVFIAERINDKFIHNRKKVLFYLCSSMTIWTFILTGISLLIKLF